LNSPRKQPPARVPTLTEVVALEAERPPLQPPPEGDRGGVQDPADRIVQELRPWIDSMFEQRLRDALTPGFDALLQDLLKQLRGEFDPRLREALSRALAQASALTPPKSNNAD